MNCLDFLKFCQSSEGNAEKLYNKTLWTLRMPAENKAGTSTKQVIKLYCGKKQKQKQKQKKTHTTDHFPLYIFLIPLKK